MPVPLPPPEIRPGERRRRLDDAYFLDTADTDARLLMSVGLRSGHQLLDFGCGPGRLAVGLIRAGWEGSYLGVDVNAEHVAWTTSHITTGFPSFRFLQVDTANLRYNRAGVAPRRLPARDGSMDIVCAFSVFSHMLADDTAAYFAEIRRVLADEGRAFVTAFVADDAPDVTENPPWLGDWAGRLHGVLYSAAYLTDLAQTAGFSVQWVAGTANERQSGVLLTV